MKNNTLIILVLLMIFLGVLTVDKISTRVNLPVSEEISEPPKVINPDAQKIFLEETEGRIHGMRLSFIPDAVIEKYRQKVAKMPGDEFDLRDAYDSILRNSPSYSMLQERDSIAVSLSIIKENGDYDFEGKSDEDLPNDVGIFYDAMKIFVNKKYLEGNDKER